MPNAFCIHCNSECLIRLAPANGHMAARHLHVCPVCPDSKVWCHESTAVPLGRAANKEVRSLRALLHDKLVDPLWSSQSDRTTARPMVYKFLSLKMGLSEAHIGDFDLAQCQEAWLLLSTETMASIRAFVLSECPDFRRPTAYRKRLGKRSTKPKTPKAPPPSRPRYLKGRLK